MMDVLSFWVLTAGQVSNWIFNFPHRNRFVWVCRASIAGKCLFWFAWGIRL